MGSPLRIGGSLQKKIKKSRKKFPEDKVCGFGKLVLQGEDWGGKKNHCSLKEGKNLRTGYIWTAYRRAVLSFKGGFEKRGEGT